MDNSQNCVLELHFWNWQKLSVILPDCHANKSSFKQPKVKNGYLSKAFYFTIQNAHYARVHDTCKICIKLKKATRLAGRKFI